MGPVRDPDPYALHDPDVTCRFAGLTWTLLGAIALSLIPVALPGNTSTLGIAVAVVLGAASLGTGVALLRGWRGSYDTLLVFSYMGLAMVAVMQLLAGRDARIFLELYLGLALFTGSVHPMRRAAPYVAAMALAAVIGASAAGWTPERVADTAVRIVIWSAVCATSSTLVAQLRRQRMLAQRGEEAAQLLADTDPLTGLGNRRRLLSDLEAVLGDRAGTTGATLVLLDLDGFKAYNDTFGHPAGDELLRRLGSALEARVAGRGRAYRMGGDEFCVLAATSDESIVGAAVEALTVHGEGFSVGASYGAILLPSEAATAQDALGLADRRMYASKSAGRASAGQQSAGVLLRLLAERDPALRAHVNGVADACERVGERVGLPQDELPALLQAAALHDVGKAAIPDAILAKAGPLDEGEWAFMRRHTLIGERIMLAAPALSRAAAYVRSSHERYDGAGYPDGLAGEDIPLGARIIAVCDAFEAMTADRPYRRAMSRELVLEELRRCAGTQFDARVVDAMCATVEEQVAPAVPAPRA